MSDVSVMFLRSIQPALESREIAIDEILAKLGFSARWIAIDPASRLPWDAFAKVLEVIADRMGGPEALDEIGADRVFRGWRALVALVSRYITPYPAFELGVRWFCPAIFHGVRGEVRKIPGGIEETVFLSPEHRESVEFFWLVRGVIRSFPSLIGWKTTSIEFANHGRRADYRLLFERVGVDRAWPSGNEPASDPECDLAELAALRMAPSGPSQDARTDPPEPRSTTFRLRHLIGDETESFDLTLREAARRLAMSERSLERSLASEGTSFRTIRDEVRLEIASTLIHRGFALEEISDRLGFRDSTSFHRAFRRWTGVSPGAFRRGGLASGHGGTGQGSGAPGHSRYRF